MALLGGTDAAGNKAGSILGAFNERTWEMRRMDGWGKPAQAPLFRAGKVYTDA